MAGPIKALGRRSRRLRFRAEQSARQRLSPGAKAVLKRVRDAPTKWREMRRANPKALRESALAEVERLTELPLISLVMPTYKTDDVLLREAVESVRAQYYPAWELVVVDDGSEDPRLEATMRELAAADRRVRFEPMTPNGGISAATNRGLELCEGEWVGFLDHDDTLTPDALLRVAQTLAADPELDVVYSDSDKLTLHGARADPFLKPDWSPVYALGAMYIGHLLVLRRALAVEAGGFDSAFDKIQDFEFMLRVAERTQRIGHIPQVLYHWRAIPGSIAAGAEEKTGVPELQARAVSAHLARRGIEAAAVPHPAIPHRAILARNGGRAAAARVSVVVAGAPGAAQLERLVEALGRQTLAEPPEIVLVAPAGTALPERPEVRRVDAPAGIFSRAAANNAGAAAASGSHLLFLGPDALPESDDALEQLLLHLSLPAVGAVGPMLVRPDGLVEAAGVAIGLANVADPMSPGIPADSDGYYGSLPCAHEVSALSAECLLVSREDFDAVGGFDEFYASQFDDFDFCQRLAARGRTAVYAPRPRVVTRRTPAERRAETDIVDRALFVDNWFDRLRAGDPYFNPAFGRERADYAPAGWRERVYRATRGR